MNLITADVDSTIPIYALVDWYIKVQPVIIHNRWYNKVYSCVFSKPNEYFTVIY